jgi:hypothetical protein
MLVLAFALGMATTSMAQEAAPVGPFPVEETQVGGYGQPAWTAHQRFSMAEVYVIPKGASSFAFALRPTMSHAPSTTFETDFRAGFGLPGRFELALDAVGHGQAGQGLSAIDAQRLGVRWAFADWGRMWGNPTMSAEWEEATTGPDVAELKLLLGGHVASGWHWGSNVGLRHEASASRQTSREWTTGLSYTVKDTKVGLGVETQLAFVNELEAGSQTARTGLRRECLIGPSLQIRPLPRMHIDIAPLFGVNRDAPRARMFAGLGWEF